LKQCFLTSIILLVVLVSYCPVSAQGEVTIVAPTSEAAEGLDLKAVSELFKDSGNLEEFEKSLNDPDLGINNLDLDENGEVDFIRIVEENADDTRVIILQVPLAENEFQDVATIEVEKTNDNDYNMQVRGNEVIYGTDYYVQPTVVHVHTWPIITWIYRPVYRPYRSVYYFGYYPRWWRPFRPVTVNVYRTRTVKLTSRTTFTVTKTNRVKSVTKVKYKPRNTTLVKKKTRVTKTKTHTGKTIKTAGVKKTTKKTGVKKTTKKTGMKKTTKKRSTTTKVKKKK